MSGKKQAVVVVHGMGEQQPMQTIRDFVKSVWMKDPKLDDPHFWNKPNSVCQSFEQRRLTTNNPKVFNSTNLVQRTDFFEYYWAHHTVGSTLEHLKGWLNSLMIRWPGRLYNNHKLTLFPIYLILWFLLIAALVVYLVFFSGESDKAEVISTATKDLNVYQQTLFFFTSHSKIMLTLIAGAFASWLTYFLVNYFGDVARYVRANPANIDIRQNIRSGGIELLERIHATGNYDRIILVGHSLGSIIAYDMLNHLWARHNKFEDASGHAPGLSVSAKTLCDELIDLSKNINDEQTQSVYRNKQHQLFTQLTLDDKNNNWLISDFITLGCPLTYADVLLFEKEEQFMWRKLDREYPTTPPVLEEGKIYYGADKSFLHHAAVFAPVRWSNIYSKTWLLAFGDIISGPVGRQFLPPEGESPAKDTIGPVREIELRWQLSEFFTHTKYWQYRDQPNLNMHLETLRRELNLYP